MHQAPAYLAMLDGVAVVAMALASAAVVACAILFSLGGFTP